MVEDDGEDGLGTTGVLDGLRGEKDLLGGGLVVGPVEGSFGTSTGCFASPFEEENDTVDGSGIEGEERLFLFSF